MQIIKNKQYLLLLISMFCVFICKGSNISVVNSTDTSFNALVDSVSLTERDSTIADSTFFNYIFIDTTSTVTNNPIQDSLLNMIEIEYTDLGGWFRKMDKLKKVRVETLLVEKVNRPIWLVGALLLILCGLGIVRLFFYSTFYNIIYGFFNDRVLAQISKEDTVLTSWPYILLYIIFSLSFGLFVTLYIGGNSDLSFTTIQNYARISAIVAFLFVAKLLLVRIISIIFEIEKIAKTYIAVLYLVYFNSMLYLMPLLILALFLPFEYFNYILIILLIGIVILFFYRITKTALSLLGNLKFSIFYLILYLCALEIAPILILVKSLNN